MYWHGTLDRKARWFCIEHVAFWTLWSIMADWVLQWERDWLDLGISCQSQSPWTDPGEIMSNSLPNANLNYIQAWGPNQTRGHFEDFAYMAELYSLQRTINWTISCMLTGLAFVLTWTLEVPTHLAALSTVEPSWRTLGQGLAKAP